MTITKIQVIKDHNGPDTVILSTDLPPSMWPWKENAHLRFQVAHGMGEAYCWNAFSMIPEVIG